MDRPDWGQAVVPERKLTHYLLALDHPEGGSKAAFFSKAGFSQEAWPELARALVEQARGGHCVPNAGPFGVKYIVSGTISCPDGRLRQIRTIWIEEADAVGPRFVTAYPQEPPP